MNAYEVSSKHFDKSAFGYRPDDVDDFLSAVAAYIEKLEGEKVENENKLVILADKVKEYRKDEESLRDALLSAQKVATSVTTDARERAEKIVAQAEEQSRNMMAEAEQKSKKLLSDAESKSKNMLSETAEKSEQEKEIYIRMKKEVSDFKQELLNIYKAHLDLITKLPEIVQEEAAKAAEEEQAAAPEEAPPAEETQAQAEEHPKETPQDVQKQFEEDEKAKTRMAVEEFSKNQEAASEAHPNFQIKLTEKKDDPLASASSRFESKFGELKFGKNADK